MLLAIGLILARIDPFHESLFVVGVIVFLLSYLILLIRDLETHSDTTRAFERDVSLKPLETSSTAWPRAPTMSAVPVIRGSTWMTREPGLAGAGAVNARALP